MEHANHRRLKMQARTLALVALACSLMTVAATAAWSREHARAECWREAAEGDTPAEGECP